MKLKNVHYFSGVIISIFVGVHLLNHFYSLFGANAHIELMNDLRIVYRNIVAELLLFSAVGTQLLSGIRLFINKRKTASGFFEKLQIRTGLYLALFFVIHLSAVLSGRLLLNLDTNLYFGVAGLNTFPLNLFFVPYYGLAMLSFFGHIAAIHSKKMKHHILGIEPQQQSYMIIGTGLILTFAIFYGLTNGFMGVDIPAEYNVLIGR